ncbi:MAG: NAD(P)H-dependent oxidoreductase subunit E [Lentisphaeria bacterium]|nr:NAD(P)H-dependent oxidoreductase subunit E [Lentisphaeria bacterium]
MTSSTSKEKLGPIGSDGVLTADAAKFQTMQDFISALTITDDIEANRGLVISTLRFAQDLYGYLPESVQLFVADSLKLHLSDIFGVVSFYSYFSTVEFGKYKFSLCCGTACHVKGAQSILETLQRTMKMPKGEHTSEDMLFTIEKLSCVGACGLAPVLVVNGEVYGQITTEQAAKLVLDVIKVEANN